MVSWFRQATKLLDTHEHRIHIIASVHTPVIQLRQGIQQIQTNPQLSGFWIHEDKAIRADSRSLKPKVSSSQVMEDIRKLGLGPTSNFTFLVALNAVESLGQEFGYHTLSRVKAAIAAAKARFAHEASANKAIGANQNVPSPSRHARWDRTLSAAVNQRRKATKAETTETTETEHICDAAAQMFLSWRRRKRMHQLPESEHATLGMKFLVAKREDPHFVRRSFSTFRISTWIFVQCALPGTGVSLPSTGCTSQRFSRASRPCFRQESEEMGTSVRRRNRRNCWWSDCRSGPANAELCELRQVSEKSCKTLEHSRLTGQTWW